LSITDRKRYQHKHVQTLEPL